jgi:spermidine/putrescine transport system permease protein
MIGDSIQRQFEQGRNWPFGAALGMSLVLLFVLAFLFTRRWRQTC